MQIYWELMFLIEARIEQERLQLSDLPLNSLHDSLAIAKAQGQIYGMQITLRTFEQLYQDLKFQIAETQPREEHPHEP